MNFVLYCIVLGIISFLFVECIYQRLKNSRDLPQLTAALFFGIISYFCLAAFYFFQGIGQYLEFWLIYSLSAFNWTFYFLFLHYCCLISLDPTNLRRHSLVLGITVGATLVNILGILSYYENTSVMLFYLICSGLGVLCFSYAIPIVWKNHKTLKEHGTKWDLYAILILLLGTVLYTTLNCACLILPKLEQFYPWYSSIAGGVTIVGVIIIMINYVFNNYIYRLPFPIVFLSLYTEDGTLLYSRQFQIPLNEEINVQEELIVKLFSAVHTFVREIIQFGTRLKLIRTRNYHIIFAQTVQKVIFSVAALNATFYLQKSIQRFITQLPEALLNELLEKRSSGSVIDKIDALLQKTFPYIKIPQKVPTSNLRIKEVPG
jgi:hypothetical protein